MKAVRKPFLRRWLAGAAVALAAAVHPAPAANAAGETRSLKLYFVHTGEKATITYKRNGRFDPKGLQELNRFLRDWRRNEPTRMDPRLFDLVWQIYRDVGGTDYIHVVSAYRSPATNSMLRSRTSGVAENSQHMLGKAMDFFIPGVSLKTLREKAVKYEAGGVGYYPSSRSPFVHLDVAGVRAWPRMGRDDLARLFPDGKTLHIPADGKPLPGYQQALAEYKARAEAPIEIAEAAGPAKPKKRNLLAFLFGGGDEDEDADAIASPEAVPPGAPAQAPAATQPVLTAAAAPPAAAAMAPVPTNRPAAAPQPPAAGTLATALNAPPGNMAAQALQAVEQAPAATAFTDLAGLAVPVPSLLARDDIAEAPPPELAAVPVPERRPESPQMLALAREASAPAAAAPAPAASLPKPPVELAALPGAVAVPAYVPSPPTAASPQNAPGTAVAFEAPAPSEESEPFELRAQPPAAPMRPAPAAQRDEPVKIAKAGRVQKPLAARTFTATGFDPSRF